MNNFIVWIWTKALLFLPWVSEGQVDKLNRRLAYCSGWYKESEKFYTLAQLFLKVGLRGKAESFSKTALSLADGEVSNKIKRFREKNGLG